MSLSETKSIFVSRINKVTLASEGVVRKEAGTNFWRGFRYYRTAWLLSREVHFMQQLAQYDRFPQVLSYGKGWLEMTYCGEGLNAANCPIDALSQMEEVATILDRARIIHRDIKLSNLVVQNGKIRLIDFSWALADGEKVYKCPRDFEVGLPVAYIMDNRVALMACLSELQLKVGDVARPLDLQS